jgi:hypothetical protein
MTEDDVRRGIEDDVWRDVEPMPPEVADAWWAWFEGRISYIDLARRLAAAAGKCDVTR